MLPKETQVLIVGAGPAGLAAAIALVKQGVQDIVVVDAVLEGQNSSRAIAIHAATLEVCLFLQVEQLLISYRLWTQLVVRTQSSKRAPKGKDC